MTARTEITCDGCGRQIMTTTGFMSEAYLKLDNVWMDHSGGAVMSTWGQRGVDSPKHFHDERCLTAYCVRGVTSEHEVAKVLALLQAADG